MIVKEERKIVEADYDWIPFIGEWVSKKLGKVEILWTYEVDLGENGQVVMSTWDDLEEDKSEIIGQLARQAIMNGIDAKTVEIKGYTIYINANIKKWTS